MTMIKVHVLDDVINVKVTEGYGEGGGSGGEPYTGAYEATPTQAEQTFRTRGKVMAQDFIVHPIPQNYGLITYNGFNIKVS